MAIFEGSGGAAEDNAAVVYRRYGKTVSPVGGRMVPGGTRNRHLSEDADGVGGTRFATHPSTKRPMSSIKADTPPVVEQPPAWSWIRRARAS